MLGEGRKIWDRKASDTLGQSRTILDGPVPAESLKMADEPNSLEPQPEAVTSVVTLATELKKLQIWVGIPSLRQLEEAAKRITGRALPRSTVSDIFAGKRLPPIDRYTTLLRALGVQDKQMKPWVDAWRTAAHAQKGIAPSAPMQPSRAAHSHSDSRNEPSDEDLAIMPIAQAAAVLDAMPPQRARAAIASMQPPVAASRISLMDRQHVASVLEQMDEVRAGDLLNRMSHPGEVLGLMSPEAAMERLQRTDPMRRQHIFATVAPAASVHMLSTVSDAQSFELLMSLEPNAAARCLEMMEVPQVVAYLGRNEGRSVAWLSQAKPAQAARWLLETDTATAARLTVMLAPEPFARLFEQLPVHKAAAIVSNMDFARAGKLLASLGVEKLEELIDVMPAHHAQHMIESTRQKVSTAELKRLFERHRKRRN